MFFPGLFLSNLLNGTHSHPDELPEMYFPPCRFDATTGEIFIAHPHHLHSENASLQNSSLTSVSSTACPEKTNEINTHTHTHIYIYIYIYISPSES